MKDCPTQDEIIQHWKGDLDTPIVSICCAAFNHEHYIKDALEGFIKQVTEYPFEILIHDDASSDGTAEIIKHYAEIYPRIIKPFIQTENQYTKGYLVFTQIIMPRARGKYIALCEGDDYWTDNKKIQQQVSFLEKNLDYVIVYGRSEPFNESGVLDIQTGGATWDLSAHELQRGPAINTLTTCFRNLLLELPNELRIAKVGDLVLWSRLGAHGKGKFLGAIAPSRYRIHAGGIFSMKSIEIRRGMQMHTYFALFLYYTRLNNKSLQAHFGVKLIKAIVRTIGVNGVFFEIVRQFCRRFVR